MAAEIDRPVLGPVPVLGPAVPVVSPGASQRERREQPPRRRRRERNHEEGRPPDTAPERGEGSSDGEPHRVDVVV
jgi:hypothetical protein